MGFMNSMKSTLNEDFNESYTENGALGYRTTGRHLLDLNFKVASLRKADAETIISGFDKAFSEDHIHALKWLFYLRDAREGLGERRSFRIIMSHMANVEPEISKVLIGLIAEYGRYDDLLSLVGTECEKNALEVIKNQLMKDMEAKKANKPVSLLAKWMPSCNATSYKTKENATVVRKYLGFMLLKERCLLRNGAKSITKPFRQKQILFTTMHSSKTMRNVDESIWISWKKERQKSTLLQTSHMILYIVI